MSTKTLFIAGAVLGLLGLATPPVHALAAAAAVTEPALSANSSTAELLTLPAVLDRALQTSPIAFGMGIIALVFLPVLTLQGIEGKMFQPMAWTFIFALLGALLVAIFL